MPGSVPRLSPDGLHPLLAAQLADVKLDARELFNDKRIWPMLEQVSATYVHAEHALHPQLLASVVAEQCDEGAVDTATCDADWKPNTYPLVISRTAPSTSASVGSSVAISSKTVRMSSVASTAVSDPDWVTAPRMP